MSSTAARGRISGGLANVFYGAQGRRRCERKRCGKPKRRLPGIYWRRVCASSQTRKSWNDKDGRNAKSSIAPLSGARISWSSARARNLAASQASAQNRSGMSLASYWIMLLVRCYWSALQRTSNSRSLDKIPENVMGCPAISPYAQSVLACWRYCLPL